ncbi:MAG: YHS domain-containing protein, partial [Myxococcales bacterium]
MASEHSHHHHHQDHGATEKAKDPVCGMNVSREQPRGGSFEHEGETYYFCNPKCRERFAADPAKYLHAAPEPVAAAADAPRPGAPE